MESLPHDEQDTFRHFLSVIYNIYGGYSAIQLSNMTHESGSPWDRVRAEYSGKIPDYQTIPNEWIRDYFAAQRKKA